MQIEFKNIHTLADLVGNVFSQSRWRNFMVQTTSILQNVFIFFLLAADATSFGKGLGMLFHDVHICLPTWVIIGFSVVLLLQARTRSLDGCQSLMYFNVAVIVVCLIVPLSAFGQETILVTRPPTSRVMAVESLTLMGFLAGINIMTFNFTIQFMAVEIVAEMRDQDKFPKALVNLAFPFLAAIFLVAGVAGYYFLGDQHKGLFINSMKLGWASRVTSACLVVFVLVTYLVKSIVLCKNIHCWFDKEGASSDTRKAWFTWNVIALITFALAWLVSQMVPFFTPFVELLGATLAPLCCMVLPVIMYVKWYHDFHRNDTVSTVQKAEWVLIALEVVLALIVMSVGTMEALETILAGWKSSGMPFDCHCEHLWSTCACSASKLGPQTCPAVVSRAREVGVPLAHNVRRMALWEF
jgi:hypothetical protein